MQIVVASKAVWGYRSQTFSVFHHFDSTASLLAYPSHHSSHRFRGACYFCRVRLNQADHFFNKSLLEVWSD